MALNVWPGVHTNCETQKSCPTRVGLVVSQNANGGAKKVRVYEELLMRIRLC